jgi:hypothetical protein
MNKDDFNIIRGSGNVFRDLGNPTPTASNCGRCWQRALLAC